MAEREVSFWWVALVAILLVAVVLGGYLFVTVPPTRPTPSGAGGQSDGVWIAVYDGIMVNYTIRTLAPYLRPGDGVALVMGNSSANFSMDNYYGELLHQALPFVTLRAYMSLDGGTGRAGGLASTIGEISPVFTEVSGDWEVHGPVEFNASYNATLGAFQEFASIVRGSGRLAIGYPSGRGILGDYSGAPYDWNYGTFARYLDGMTIESQGLCVNHTQWPEAVSKVWGEYNASGVSTSTLSLQISLGSGGNGVNATEASYCANYWRGVDHGNVFLWWGPDLGPSVVDILQAIGR